MDAPSRITYSLAGIAPPGWIMGQRRLDGASFYFQKRRQFTAIISSAIEHDGRRWIHLSIARRDHLPSWGELVRARDAFLGPEVRCLQVVAPTAEHVNIHDFCLHLWHCPEGDGIPDFTQGKATI
jgi:hypothetical protein